LDHPVYPEVKKNKKDRMTVTGPLIPVGIIKPGNNTVPPTVTVGPVTNKIENDSKQMGSFGQNKEFYHSLAAIFKTNESALAMNARALNLLERQRQRQNESIGYQITISNKQTVIKYTRVDDQ
jgi:hypothetical protein